VLAESWHSIERAFGRGGDQDLFDELDPQPFVPTYDSGGAMADEKVKVTAADTTTGFLAEKVVAGANVSLATLNPGADEDLEISALDEKVKASATDTTPGFLDQKLVEGLGIDLTLLNPGADEDVEIKADVGEIENNLTYGVPITVRGPTNAPGATDVAHADHDHRLEYEVEDEGVLVSARPRMNFVGAGVGAVDLPGLDKTEVTIPGNVTDGAVVKRSTYVGASSSTSSTGYVDGMAGLNVTVPIDGDYLCILEGEAEQQNASAVLEIALSVNSVTVPTANSERKSQGNASDMRAVVTSVQLPGLVAGDLVRALFRKFSGAQSVTLHRRHLILIKVQ